MNKLRKWLIKKLGGYDYLKGRNMFEFSGDREKLMLKLGQLEDIEEELGIDLVKLLNAQSLWVIDYGKPYESEPPIIDFINRQIVLADHYIIHRHFDFKDYGKTWAFTKEELE